MPSRHITTLVARRAYIRRYLTTQPKLIPIVCCTETTNTFIPALIKVFENQLNMGLLTKTLASLDVGLCLTLLPCVHPVGIAGCTELLCTFGITFFIRIRI